MRIWLVRHGRTSWNAERKAQGHADIPLDEVGNAQARALAARLKGEPIQTLYSSDLKRAKATALPSAAMLNLHCTERHGLRERDFGDWEGKTFSEILRLWVTIGQEGVPVWERCPPGGESLRDVLTRVKKETDHIIHAKKNALVITHGVAAAAFIVSLIGGEPKTMRAFTFSNVGITTLRLRPEGAWLIETLNDDSYLEPRLVDVTE